MIENILAKSVIEVVNLPERTSSRIHMLVTIVHRVIIKLDGPIRRHLLYDLWQFVPTLTFLIQADLAGVFAVPARDGAHMTLAL